MDKVKEITSKTFITTLITFIGLLSAIITIYAYYFQNNTASINFEIITNSNVYDINTNISKLDILYDSTSLKQKNENLRVISIKIKNNGNVDLLKTFYDDKSPLGLIIKNGYIVELPEIVETSNDYLKSNLSLKKDSINRIIFSDIILDRDEFFVIKFLLLHKTNEIPEIIPIGKIAGIKEIKIINSSEAVQETSFWSKVFIGNIFVQIVKGLIYFTIILILIISSILLSELITSKIELFKKRKLIKNFKKSSKYKHKKINDVIFDTFEVVSLKKLKHFFGMLADEKGINENYQKWQELIRLKEEKEAVIKDYVKITEITLPDGYRATLKDEIENEDLNSLIDKGFIISNNNGQLVVNKELKKTLENFIEFIGKSNFKNNNTKSNVSDEEIKID